MKKLAVLHMCVLAFLVVCAFGSYRIFQWFAIRRVLSDIDAHVVAFKSIPKDASLSDRIEAVDRLEKSVIVVDVSYTPKDFKNAFELWKVAWTSLDKKMKEYDFPIGMNFAERQLVTDTSTRLDQLRMKYGFGASGEAPVRSLIGDIGDGLFNVGVGEYFLLLGLGICKASKDPVKDEMLRRKWSVWAMFAGLFLLSEGVFKLYNDFS